MPPIHNYHCTRNDCTYKNTATDAAGAEKQLTADGGSDAAKVTSCPDCRNDALVFLA